jgi:SAM-dependent methyltransferase
MEQISPSNYKDTWNDRSVSRDAAIAAVDGSTDETLVQHTGRWAAEQIRVALDVKTDDRVLELGCGVGRIGRELAPHCQHWTGVDISENMIAHAGQRLADRTNASFHQLTRTSLDMLEDNSFDKAYSIAVFCHMDKEDLFLYMQELNRVIKPGGMIFVETWNLVSDVGWRRWEYEPLVWKDRDHGKRKDVARNQFCTPEEFELYVSKAGFQPLANFHASQSIQICAGNGLSEERIRNETARISAHSADIAYSELYAELFAQLVDVIFGRLHPREMLDFLDKCAETSEAKLYRPYLHSLWKKSAELWGDAPD